MPTLYPAGVDSFPTNLNVPDVALAKSIRDMQDAIVMLETLGGGVAGTQYVRINVIMRSPGGALTSGVAGEFPVGAAYQIVGWTLLADQSGSIQIDVQKTTYASYPTAASICGGNKPAIVTATKATDSGIGSWDTALAADDILVIVIDSATAVTRATLSLRVTPVVTA